MTNEPGVQERHGAIGEARTVAILLQRFCVMKRIPDLEGADYLIQRAPSSEADLRARRERIEAFGVVQSKYIIGAHEVVIPATYVMDERGPRTEFFLLIHSDDEQRTPTHYFFTAEQIIEDDDFYSRENSKGNREFVFARAAGRHYPSYRDLPVAEILDSIEEAISRVEQERNERFVEEVIRTTVPPAMIRERVSLSLIPDAVPEVRIPHRGVEYLLKQKGPVIEVTKYSQASDTTTSVGEFVGRLGEVAFDPSTETFRQLHGI